MRGQAVFERQFAKVFVASKDNPAFSLGPGKYIFVRFSKIGPLNLGNVMSKLRESRYGRSGEILVSQKLHASCPEGYTLSEVSSSPA